MKHSVSLLTVLLLPLASAFSQGLDTFDSYLEGSIIGQTGPTPPWASGMWNQHTSDGGNISGTAQDGALKIEQVGTSGYASVSRRYEAFGLPLGYTIEFDLTLNNFDSILAGGGYPGFQNAADYISIFDRVSEDSTAADFASDGTWLVRGAQLNAGGAPGTQINYNPDAPLNWYAYSFTPLVSSGFPEATVFDTGVALVEGATYHFKITILGGGEWGLAIESDFASYDSMLADGPFGFRSAADLPSGKISWGFGDYADNPDTADGVDMTLDNVLITVPEPSAVVLAMLALSAFTIFGGFRRRGARHS